MNKTIVVRCIIWIIAGAVSLAGFSAATSAYQLVASPHELTASPLWLVGYKRSDSQTLQYLQLYNNGDAPLNLNDWTVKLNVQGENILPRTEGYLLPGQHTVIGVPGEVGLGETPPLTSYKTDITLEKIAVFPPADTLYTTDIYTLKTTGTIVNQSWRRAMFSRNTYSSSLTSFELTTDTLFYDPLYLPPETAHMLQVVEVYPYGKSCSPFDANVFCRDYVKLYNPTVQTVQLEDYTLRTDSNSSNRTSSNTLHLTGKAIGPGEYLTLSQTDDGGNLGLTNSGGYVWLEDAWGLMRYDDTITHYESAGIAEQGMSWAETDDGVWQWSATPQPNGSNSFPPQVVVEAPSVFADCPAGKYRNPETNRCRTIEEAVNALAACAEDQVRNPETNRCRSVLSATSTLVPCKEGQERSPETNRCRSIASAVAELLPCDEGYERNPVTHRCRKATGETMQSGVSGPASVPLAQSGEGMLKTVLIAAVVTGAVGYGLYEWRSEVGRFVRRIVPLRRP